MATSDIDTHIGKRIRFRRIELGLSQAKLAERTNTGLAYQQHQKYESGQNRVSAAMLWHLATALDVPLSYYFEGLKERKAPKKIKHFTEGINLTDLKFIKYYLSLPAASKHKAKRAFRRNVD